MVLIQNLGLREKADTTLKQTTVNRSTVNETYVNRKSCSTFIKLELDRFYLKLVSALFIAKPNEELHREAVIGLVI